MGILQRKKCYGYTYISYKENETFFLKSQDTLEKFLIFSVCKLKIL